MDATQAIMVEEGCARLARAVAGELTRLAAAAVASRGACHLAVGGDDLTSRVLAALAADGAPPRRESLPWDRIHFVMTDERPGPAEHPEGRYRAAYDALFSRIPLRPGNVVRFFSEGDDLEFVCTHTEGMIRELMGLGPADPPRFDLVLLRLGAGGEVAGLSPGSEALGEERRLAAAPEVGADGSRHLTLTPAALRGARAVWFVATGPEAAPAVRAAVRGDDPGSPARAVRPVAGAVRWFLDRDAAGLLEGRDRPESGAGGEGG